MRPTTLCMALSAVLLSASAWADPHSGARTGARTGSKKELKVKKVSMSQYRVPSSFSGERCFEWRIRSRWDLCSR